MTGKTRIKRELDEMTDGVLRDLEPRERLGFILEATARGDDAWREKLWAKTPTKGYKKPDARVTQAYQMIREVGHALLAELQGLAVRVRERLSAVEVTDIFTSSSSDGEEADATMFEPELQDTAAELVARWAAWDRFAQSELGIPLETWLGGLLGPDYPPFQHAQETRALLTGELLPEGWAREVAKLAGAGPDPDLLAEVGLDPDTADPVTIGRRLIADVLYGRGRVRLDGHEEGLPVEAAVEVLYEDLRARLEGTVAPS